MGVFLDKSERLGPFLCSTECCVLILLHFGSVFFLDFPFLSSPVWVWLIVMFDKMRVIYFLSPENIGCAQDSGYLFALFPFTSFAC